LVIPGSKIYFGLYVSVILRDVDWHAINYTDTDLAKTNSVMVRVSFVIGYGVGEGSATLLSVVVVYIGLIVVVVWA
jgi:hypothetical protein